MAVLKFHFHKGTSIYAKLIRWRTGSDINHCHVEFNNVHYEIDLGKTLSKGPVYVGNVTDIISFEIISPELNEKIGSFLESSVGRKYDKKSIWGFIHNKRKQSNSRYYCSEHCNKVLDLITEGRCKLDKKLVTPHSFRDRVSFFALGLKPQSYEIQAHTYRRL